MLFPDDYERDEASRIKILRRRLANPDSDEGRKAWYRLLALACLMSEGRRTSELRRFWTDELEGTENFWALTSQPHFSTGADTVFDHLCKQRFVMTFATYERSYYWRRVFYDVRKMHRLVWEFDFPSVILERAGTAGAGRELIEFIRSGYLPGQERWIGVIGQSIGSPLFFVIRELRRLGVITTPKVDSAAFFPCRPVRRAAVHIGWLPQEDMDVWKMDDLLRISHTLYTKAHSSQALCRDYDMPLLHMGIMYRGENMPTPPKES